MQAHEGDVLRFVGRTVGTPEHHATVLEVVGDHGEPPYRVRFDNGREAEVCPGSDCVHEHHAGGRTAAD
ncbi:DUF1918 domain-containing protein [Streptomyces sp. NBC_01476]|uniref:DUF1918 domain-containing protein n=1 Tax=Streptomyces sp. NBC_01476 TaxID=2903881 RepID=UPI002E333445|nr:DUF1918 domain-containing protein [Streptomyces sp. NBC_01476]